MTLEAPDIYEEMVMPPRIIEEAETDDAVQRLKKALDQAWAEVK